VAISYDPQPQRSLRIVPVLMERLLLVGPAGAGLELDGALPFAQVAERDLILPGPGHGLRLILESCARQAGVTLRPQVEVESFNAMVGLVRAGLGFTVLPLAPIHEHVRSGAVTATRLSDPTPERRLVLAYSADRPINPAARFVGDAFVALVSDLVARGVWMGDVIEERRG
jgi:LysR family transcriptional regulator, nitrogen assimilation regulatory protein